MDVKKRKTNDWEGAEIVSGVGNFPTVAAAKATARQWQQSWINSSTSTSHSTTRPAFIFAFRSQ